jgi:phospholipase/lecithinase/hemolysin
MILRAFSRAAFALAACCSIAPLAASAADFSAEYVFGDSLSDNGNLASIGVKFTDPPSTIASPTERSRFSCWRKAWDLAPILPTG